MKRSEYFKIVQTALNGMFSSCNDDTKVGKMFAHEDPSAEFNIQNFIVFLNSSYLTKYQNIYGHLFTDSGQTINIKELSPVVANAILEHFRGSNINKETTFAEAFAPRNNSIDYFPELAEVIVHSLEQHGKPPLFHQRQDKILKYEWERE